MTALSDFDPDIQDALISLPYKVGVYISHADDADGEYDDELEMKALERCIRAIAKLHDNQPLVADVMRETLSRQDHWDRWGDDAFTAPAQAQKAIAAVARTGTKQNVKNYRAALMEIASTVAQAYGDFGEFDDDESDSGFFGGLVTKIVGGFSSLSEEDSGHPVNISAAEDSAISRLALALKTE